LKSAPISGAFAQTIQGEKRVLDECSADRKKSKRNSMDPFRNPTDESITPVCPSSARKQPALAQRELRTCGIRRTLVRGFGGDGRRMRISLRGHRGSGWRM